MITAYTPIRINRNLLLTGCAGLALLTGATARAESLTAPGHHGTQSPPKAASLIAAAHGAIAISGDAFAWDLLCTPTASGHRRGCYPAESPNPAQASSAPPSDYDDNAFLNATPRDYVGMGASVIPTGYQGISGAKLYQLGSRYEQGMDGYEKNVKRALGCYLSGAAEGDVECITRIAKIFRDGEHGVAPNPALADAWETAADGAKSRPVSTEVPLSPIQQVNISTTSSTTSSGPIYNPADFVDSESISHEHRGLSGSQVFKMGDDFEKGKNGKPKDMQRAIGCYLSGAAMGNVYCIARMGACYRLGNGVAKNPQLAADWYEAAAAKGEAGSMYRLGEAYEKGEGRPQDLDRARELYSQAAAKGDSLSAKALSRIGQGSTTPPAASGSATPATSGSTSGSAAFSGDLHSPADYVDSESIRHEHRGLSGSQVFKMGDDFEKGKNGKPKDMQRAIGCYLSGAAMGNVYCIARMGACYRLGNGVAKNPQLAADWYEAAAAKGEAGSMYRLGEAYEKGEGRPQDLDRARELYSKAAAKGDSLSAKALRRLGH